MSNADYGGAPPYIAWTPDSRSLVTTGRTSQGACGLILLSVDTGEQRQLTSPKLTPPYGDSGPAFSPDGRTLAFARAFAFAKTEIFVLPLSSTGTPQGEPQQVTNYNCLTMSPIWTPDGREIIFSSTLAGAQRLFRGPASGKGQPRPLLGAGEDGYVPTLAKDRRTGQTRLVYTKHSVSWAIWRVANRSEAKEFITSNRGQSDAQYSPDGAHIVFSSDRSSAGREILTCDADGANCTQLTFSQGRSMGSPRWSPDGRMIAYDGRLNEQSDIYVVSASGGAPRRITTDSAEHVLPSFSRDGRWIYFGSNRTGTFEIWKIPLAGGQQVQVTTGGGFCALESADGTTVYYSKGNGPTSLWKTSGGQETLVIPELRVGKRFQVFGDGIYSAVRNIVSFQSFATGNAEQVAVFPSSPTGGLGVSPDRNSFLVHQRRPETADLMLIDNFQ